MFDMRVRPLPGLHFNILEDGQVDLCKEPPYTETCQNSAHWLRDLLVVSNDLFIGQQLTRPKRIPEKQETMSVDQAQLPVSIP